MPPMPCSAERRSPLLYSLWPQDDLMQSAPLLLSPNSQLHRHLYLPPSSQLLSHVHVPPSSLLRSPQDFLHLASPQHLPLVLVLLPMPPQLLPHLLDLVIDGSAPPGLAEAHADAAWPSLDTCSDSGY